MGATDYRLRCPHGHVVKRMNGGGGAFNGRAPISAFYCRTCKDQDRSGHYDKNEIEDTGKDRSNVDLGYVWSPSHDREQTRSGSVSDKRCPACDDVLEVGGLSRHLWKSESCRETLKGRLEE